MIPRSRPLVATLAALAACAASSRGQSTGFIDEQQAKRLGGTYAAIINFAENPDIATAHYYIDEPSGDDPILRVTRFRGQHEFDLENHAWTPFIQLHIPYQTLKAFYDLEPRGSIQSKWSAIGAILMTGVKFPATSRFSINPVLAWGYVRLENDAHYAGDVAAIEPIFKGILFDWSSDAWLFGGSLWLDYDRPVGRHNLRLHAGATHNLIETFESISGHVEFSSYATTLTARGEWTQDTGMRIRGHPLAVVFLLGSTAFAGPYREELGFSYFMDTGLAFELDLSERDFLLSRLRLGAKAIYGEEVAGWSAILSWKF